MHLGDLALLATCVVTLACDRGATLADPGEEGALVIVQDMASDEAWLSFKDAVDQGRTTVDTTKAAALIAPSDGAAMPAATVPTFQWTLPMTAGKTPRHGVETGKFVWLDLSGGGLTAPIDVDSITSTSWTPDAATWATLVAAHGTIVARIYTATMDRGVVTDGPYAPNMNGVSFTIAR